VSVCLSSSIQRFASAVVTGGAREIGRCIAELMVRRGHHAVLTDVDGAAARRTADEIGPVAGLVHDVRDGARHQEVAEEEARDARRSR
jgi:NAD(P)-dependent dehydrogenase (short-subunit alcohol dehydrogenase family)